MFPEDEEDWPPSLSDLVGSEAFARRIKATATREMGYVTEEEVFDGISSFLIRAIRVGDGFLARFPSSFSVVRYILISIKNARKREAKRQEREVPTSPDDLAAVESKQASFLEEAVLAYFGRLFEEGHELADDPAGLTQDERMVLKLRWDGATLEQVGRQMSFSKSTASRLEQSALHKLQQWFGQ